MPQVTWVRPETRLDWLLTPNHELEEHLHVEPLQASTKFYLRFTLLRVRSLGFGSYPSDSRHFHTLLLTSCELIGFPSDAFLNYPRHSDTLPGPLFETYGTTPKSRTMLKLLGFRLFSLPVTGFFQLSITVLVRYRTQNVFRVGS